jgi:hypothetical protein
VIYPDLASRPSVLVIRGALSMGGIKPGSALTRAGGLVIFTVAAW